jgi:ribosomal protein S18 acetylase RimI-like enzyme
MPGAYLTPAELAAAADENLATHFTWVQRQTAGMRAAIASDLVLTECGMPCDTFNAVCRARLSSSAASMRIREAIAWFAGRPFSWWVGPADEPGDLGARLSAERLSPAESEVAMAADLSRLRAIDTSPGGLEIRRARAPGELADFARVNAANWDPPDRLLVRFYELAAPALLAPDSPLRMYVGYAGGEAVAASELTVGGGVAGLYGISTLAAHRHRGYGSAMTAYPLLEARGDGIATAVLQASAAGRAVYERIGFEKFGEITEYKPEGSNDGS